MTTTLQELDEVLASIADDNDLTSSLNAERFLDDHAPEIRAALELQASGDELARIGELIRTQDNRITDSPIFIVQQKRWIHGVDLDYSGERVWIHHADSSEEITDDDEIARLDAEYNTNFTVPEGYTLTGKVFVWEFVTACFTEQGCKDYIARDGHNLKEPRIYAEGSYRNEEWRTVRNFIAALPAPPAGGQDDN